MARLSETTRGVNIELSSKLSALIRSSQIADEMADTKGTALQNADAIVSHVEVNDRHGVGVLLRRMFGRSNNILSIRSKNLYEGRQDFGAMHVCISHENTSRDEVFWKTVEALRGVTVKRVICIPYYPDDVRSAIALKELFDAPLCTFVMDDQNLCAEGIPDALMRELLSKSELRLAISPEMCAAYELKYGYRTWYLPPLVPSQFILPYLNKLPDDALRSESPLIIGNIWGRRWLELLRGTVRDSGIMIRWYNNGVLQWLSCTKEELASDGIDVLDGAGDGVIEILRQAPFVVVPSGILDDTDDRRFIAQLSLPSRIPYMLATSQTPMLVLGSAETAAARFVTASGIGIVAPYERAAFLEAVERILRPEVNLEMRRAALRMAGRFSDTGVAEWIWQSLALGKAVDSRFEEMMPQEKSDLARFTARSAGESS